MLSLNPQLTVFKYFKISTLFDNQSNVVEENLTVSVPLRGIRELPVALRSQHEPPASGTGRGSTDRQSDVGRRDDNGFLEDGSFWKWRELSVRASAPDAWVHRLRVSALSFTVAGRNLRTWTKYTGADPEINSLSECRRLGPAGPVGVLHAAASIGTGPAASTSPSDHPSHAYIPSQHPREPRGLCTGTAGALAAEQAPFVALVAGIACNPANALKIPQPDNVNAATVNSITALPALLAGTQSAFQIAYSGAGDRGKRRTRRLHQSHRAVHR